MRRLPLAPQGRLARPDKRLQGRLELLRVRVSLLVDNDEVDRQSLHPPVLMGAEELPDDSSILGLVDSDQDDREVAGDPVSPEGGGPRGVALEHVRWGP